MLMMKTMVLVMNTTLLLKVVKGIVLELDSLMNRLSTDMNVSVYLVIIEMNSEYVKKNVLVKVTFICILVLMIEKVVVVMPDIPIMLVNLLVKVDQALVLVLIL
jgi:hypothetical protein